MSPLLWGVFVSILVLVTASNHLQDAVCPTSCPQNETVVQGLRKKQRNADTICEKAVENCDACFTDSSSPWCKSVGSLFGGTGILSTPSGQDIPQPPGCNMSDPDSDACKITPPPGRRKRSDPEPVDFHPKYVWHQDSTADKRKQCCVTTKRVIHFIASCGKECYPVYCPLAGGHQFIDEVVCNIKNDKHRRKYLARYFSQPDTGPCMKERGKKCRVAFSVRTYLVTNVPPQGWWGHCLYAWVPVWFKNLAVPTHCYCPEK